jgi:uncharacterized damage-inducible protein DinB
MRRVILAFAGAAFALPLLAQSHMDMMATHWKTAATYTLAIADQMPAENYGFKPVPEEMSFAEQLVHIAQANAYMFGVLTGDKFTEAPPKEVTKENVTKFVRDSFDWTTAELAKITPEEVQKSYPMEGHQMSGHEVLMLAWNHTTHHRGQLIVYLRLKGIKPTDYKF